MERVFAVTLEALIYSCKHYGTHLALRDDIVSEVLWPECGWQPVSLADLITGASVKKAYRKATLSIHPDKVQQKGATLQLKYISEKVFDLLKEYLTLISQTPRSLEGECGQRIREKGITFLRLLVSLDFLRLLMLHMFKKLVLKQ